MITRNPAAILLHTISTTVVAYAWFNLDNIPNNRWIVRQRGGYLQYLTIQGLIAAWLTMAVSLVADFTSSGPAKRLKRMLLMVSMPTAVLIATVYWGSLLLMPSAILQPKYPEGLDPRTPEEAAEDLMRIPICLDLALHAVPCMVLLMDFFLLEKKYPKNNVFYDNAVLAFAVGMWYTCWAEWCASYNGLFPYPFLTANPLPVRVLIYICGTAFAYVIFMLLNGIRQDSPFMLPSKYHGAAHIP